MSERKLLLVVVDSTLRLEGGGESAARGRSSEPLFRWIAMIGTFELDVLKSNSIVIYQNMTLSALARE